MTEERLARQSPAIRAIDPWLPGLRTAGRASQLLTDEERTRLTTIASIVRFQKGEIIYEQGRDATKIFNIISGVVKAYQASADGSEHIAAFLYAEDLFGLSEEGRYVCSARALSAVSAYALPIAALRRRLAHDAGLDYSVIVKLCHELRQAQRHAFLLAQRHALTKVAMFLQMQEHLQASAATDGEIYLPMARSDIAEYVGISLAAVSRAFRTLVARQVVRSRGLRYVHVLDRAALDAIAEGEAAESPALSTHA